MKKTRDITEAHNPADLHQAFDAAGIPVLTIRSDWTESEKDIPLCSVAVFADGYDPDSPANAAAIQAIIDDQKQNNLKVKNKAVPVKVGYDVVANLAHHRIV